MRCGSTDPSELGWAVNFMNKPTYRIQLTPEQTLEHLTRITSGLLAGRHLTVEDEIGVTASSVLRELMLNIEGEINEGNLDRYIDKGDPRRNFLPGSDNDRRKAWLKNPVEHQPDSTED
jgi:hypothetical protein